ncbi:endonuclease domain-containing protein [Hyphococcus sp.]|uniref:endonuclease domain-containing protein n=1 Tax=Hyphococcus sp. TaxID=2038636 RepID=UPI003CCC0D6C
MTIRKPHPNARTLRKDMPETERRLWSRLRNKELGGFRFRRQHTIGPYIADFACVEAKLVIELDGEQHALGNTPVRDVARDTFMEREGWMVLRFWNHEVRDNMNGVLDAIIEAAGNSVRCLKMKEDNFKSDQ